MKIENVVYIITNPQYPGYVKIGYASDLKSRISSLNTGALVEFEPYAAYETPKDMADIEIHEIIKLLNPILRASKFEKGKVRQKEFFKLDPEEAFQLLEHIAIVSGTRDKLYKVDRNFNKYEEFVYSYNDSQVEENTYIKPSTDTGNNVHNTPTGKRGPFTFSYCDIPVGATICFVRDETKVATVIDDKYVLYENEKFSLSKLAQILMKLDRPLQGPLYFKYNGKLLTEIRNEKDGLYNK